MSLTIGQEIGEAPGVTPVAPAASTPATPGTRCRLVRVKDVAWLVYLYPVRWISRVMPIRLAYAMADAIARVAPLFLRVHRRRLAGFLSLAFPNDHALVDRICWSYFQKAVVRFFDDLLIGRLMRNGGLRNVELIHLEHLTDALSAGKGAVLTSGHFLASRVGKCHLTASGFPSLTLRNPNPNDDWAGRLGKQYLQKRYAKLVGDVLGEQVKLDDPDCSLKLLSRLRSGGLIGIHADIGFSQHATQRQFLGRERMLANGYLHLAWIAAAPVVPYHCRGSARRLVIEFDPPILPAHWADRDSFVAYAADHMWQTLETHVRRTPEQWDLWMRW